MFPCVSEVAEYAGRTKGRAAYSLNSGREDVKRGGLFRDHGKWAIDRLMSSSMFP
jgi:hypothetical protein